MQSYELGVNRDVVARVDRDTYVEVVAGFAMCALLVNRRPSEERRMP